MRKFAPNRFHGFLATSAALIAVAVAITGLLVARVLERHVLAQEERHTAQVVRAQTQLYLIRSDFELPGSAGQHERFELFRRALPGVFRVKVFDRRGTIVWSNEPKLIGQRFPDNHHVARALGGDVAMVLEVPKRSEHVYERTKAYVAEAYVPIALSGGPEVLGVIETYTDVSHVMGEIRRAQALMWGVAAGLGVLLYVALAVIVWKSRSNELRAVRQLEAEKRLAALGRLAAGVAHELRNPLTVLVGRIELLKVLADRQLAGTKLSPGLAQAEDAANRMAQIVKSLSMYSKPPQPERALLNIGDLLRATQDLVARQAQQSGVTVTVNAAENLPPVLGDRSQLMQVLLNLAMNAVEAMAGTGGRLTLRALVQDGSNGKSSLQPGRSVRLEISDTGPGILPESLQKIWEAFYTTKSEGTGLGLSIVRSLVAEQPGATIDVESQPRRGTTFILTMPVAGSANQEGGARELAPAAV